MMKLRHILMIAGLLSVWLTVGAMAQTTEPPPRDDGQFWNETQIVVPWGPKRDLYVIGVLRMGRDFRRPVDERIGGAVAFKVHPNLMIMPMYLHVTQQPFAGSSIHEHRLNLNITGKVALGKFTFTDRNLIERRVRHSQRDFTMYRNRLQIDYPVKIGDATWKPFIADEVFYATQTTASGRAGWFRNRIGGGILRQFNENFYAEFFYVYQHDGVSRPGNVHAIGTLFRFIL